MLQNQRAVCASDDGLENFKIAVAASSGGYVEDGEIGRRCNKRDAASHGDPGTMDVFFVRGVLFENDTQAVRISASLGDYSLADLVESGGGHGREAKFSPVQALAVLKIIFHLKSDLYRVSEFVTITSSDLWW
mmetsp:Transcript_26979/g.79711  ORF Transcript_26979/g.79711 Transcript_26979/m.79711 type:complete len:133 (-) Transcript_26979:1414-1812(-)